VHNCHQQDSHNEAKEELIVGGADAVVEPAAVVIEVVDAAIAGAAVFR